MILALVTALGAIPEGVRPAAAPVDAPTQYATEHPDGPGLACAPLLEAHAALCFRVWTKEKRRWVTQEDIVRWGTTVDGLVAHVTTASKGVLANEPHVERVVDMDAEYGVLRDGDGFAVAPFLHGPQLAVRFGPDVRAVIPRTGVMLAWKAGSPELDQVMAVAAREMYDTASDSVTPMVHMWRDGRFIPFGQANPKGG